MIRQTKIFKNKRGEDMLVDFWAILVFALIVLLFFILFSANKDDTKTNEIKDDFSTKDMEFILNSFLKAPAVGIDTQKTVADIIIEDSISKPENYERTEQLFEEYYTQTNLLNGYRVNDISMEINGYDMKIIASGGSGTFGKFVKVGYEEALAVLTFQYGGIHEDYKSYNTKVILPAYTKDVIIEFEMSTWNVETVLN